MSRLVVLVLAWGLAAGPGAGHSPDPKNLAIPAEELARARELVRKLASEVYRERELAHDALARMGRLAKPVLAEAATADPDPEVRSRAARLLPQAAADDLKARVDAFLADADGQYEHNLPAWDAYRKLVGADRAARDLYVEMVKSGPSLELLAALELPADQAGRAISDRRFLMQAQVQRRIGPDGVLRPINPLALPDIAALLFAECLVPSKDIPRVGPWASVTGATFVQQPASLAAVNNPDVPHAGPYRHILARWLDTRVAPDDLNIMYHIGGTTLKGFKETTPLLRRVVTTPGVNGYPKGQAMMYLVQRNGKEEIPFLKSQLTNDTPVTQVFLGPGGGANARADCQVRDVALALLLHQTGQRLPDYGFRSPPGVLPNPVQNLYNYGFVSDEDRAAALVKFAWWQFKQGLGPTPDGKK
jgi:hypothetical protein